QLIDRNPETLAQDVPQSAIDAAQRIVALGSRAEVFLEICGLPDVLDFVAILADDKWLEAFFNVSLCGLRNFLMGGRSEAVEPRLAGFHLDDGPVRTGRRGGDDFHIGNLEWGHT